MIKLPENFELDRYGIHVRLVREGDAEFIVKLRTNGKLSQYIHKTDSNIAKQLEWIRAYKQREAEGKEYYFIFSYQDKNVGVARIYDIESNRFTSGSWLASSNMIGIGVLCDIISREIAFELYPESNNYFDVRKGNKNVIRYHQSYHPLQYKEDDENVYFSLSRLNFEKYKQLYLRMAKI